MILPQSTSFRKSVTYPPSVDRSPNLGSSHVPNGQEARGEAKVCQQAVGRLPKVMTENLWGMALSGEKPSRATPSVEAVVQPIFTRIRLNEGRSVEQYNVGMYDLDV